MSSESESDEDYIPGEPEQLSEEESADEETEKQYEAESDHKNKKRKVAENKNGKKGLKKVKQNVKEKETISEEDKEPDKKPDLEDEKKREEDLWATFLEGTDTKPKPQKLMSSNEHVIPLANQDKLRVDDKQKDDAKEREKKIFEFAGETIVVENNVIKERIKSDDKISEGKYRFRCLLIKRCESGGSGDLPLITPVWPSEKAALQSAQMGPGLKSGRGDSVIASLNPRCTSKATDVYGVWF